MQRQIPNTHGLIMDSATASFASHTRMLSAGRSNRWVYKGGQRCVQTFPTYHNDL